MFLHISAHGFASVDNYRAYVSMCLVGKHIQPPTLVAQDSEVIKIYLHWCLSFVIPSIINHHEPFSGCTHLPYPQTSLLQQPESKITVKVTLWPADSQILQDLSIYQHLIWLVHAISTGHLCGRPFADSRVDMVLMLCIFARGFGVECI